MTQKNGFAYLEEMLYMIEWLLNCWYDNCGLLKQIFRLKHCVCNRDLKNGTFQHRKVDTHRVADISVVLITPYIRQAGCPCQDVYRGNFVHNFPFDCLKRNHISFISGQYCICVHATKIIINTYLLISKSVYTFWKGCK